MGTLSHENLERAYANAVRMVDRDADILDQLRSRASILLAALAIGGAILGSILPAVTHPPVPWWVVVPLVLPVVLCVLVLWSTRDHGSLTIPVARSGRAKKPRTTVVPDKPGAAIPGATVRAQQAIVQASAVAEPLQAHLVTIQGQAEIAAAELERVRALAQAGGGPGTLPVFVSSVEADHARRAREAIEQVRAAAEALGQSAVQARDHAVAAAAALEQMTGWRRFTRRVGGGWDHFMRPWKEWFWALVDGDQRLWKTRLNRKDMSEALDLAAEHPALPKQDVVDWFLLQRLYVAHRRNDGTINRRADLLRFAAAFAFLFVLALGIWLSTTA